MLDFVRSVFNVCLKTTNYAHNAISSMFYLSKTIGYWIVKSLLIFYASLCDAFSAIIALVCVLYEDFSIFINDFGGKIYDVLSLLFNGASTTLCAVRNVFVATKDSIFNAYDEFLQIIQVFVENIAKSFEFIVNLAELAKWSVILIGRGFWLAIQLVPLSLLYLGYSLFSLIVYMLLSIYEQFSTLVNYVTGKSRLAGEWTFNYIFDFPLESLFGLILGTILIIIVKVYHRRIIRGVVRSVRRTTRLIRSAFMCVWLATMHRAQNWRRNIHPPVIDISDTDSTQEDEEILRPVRRSLRLQNRAGASTSKISPNSEVLRRELELEREEKLCVVCQDQPKCVIVIPCRHLCLCTDCSLILEHTTGICPICRRNFERSLSVFM